jgi:hypothetical protein
VFAGRSRYHSRQNIREQNSLSPPPVAARRHARRHARSPERSPFGNGPTQGVSPFARAASTPVSNDETPDKKRKRSVRLDQLVPYGSDGESL